MSPQPGVFWRIYNFFSPTIRFWLRTEIHVYSFSVAANVLLSFFPFLIVSVSLSRILFDYQTTVAAIDLALKDYFPTALSNFMQANLPARRPPQVIAILVLLFTANGIFEPLEVALNHVWGIRKNRSFLKNQILSLVLILGCGALAMASLWLMALGQQAARAGRLEAWVAMFFLKAASLPILVFILFLVYRFLPNGKTPISRIVPAAVGVGLLLEALKLVNEIFWPGFDAKIQSEYGVFHYSVTIIFLGFISSMLFLAGAEWAARGHRLDHERHLIPRVEEGAD
jgi:uncharacterized BrkB/YihY/UPF0761 family membrane protein